MCVGKRKEKDIFGDEFEIYVANKRKLKVLTRKRAASTIYSMEFTAVNDERIKCKKSSYKNDLVEKIARV